MVDYSRGCSYHAGYPEAGCADCGDADVNVIAPIPTPPVPTPPVPVVVVTRHANLVAYLVERGIVTGDVVVLSHVTVADVTGCHVVGILPFHLAVHAASVTVLDLDIPAALRGVELSVEQLRLYGGAVTSYRVFDADAITKLLDEAGY